MQEIVWHAGRQTEIYMPSWYLGDAHVSQSANEVSRNNIKMKDGCSFLDDRLVHCNQVPARIF